MSYIFATQDDYAEEQWLDKTVNQFLDEISNKFSSVSVIILFMIRKYLKKHLETNFNLEHNLSKQQDFTGNMQ